MDEEILKVLYTNDLYLTYLRYHPGWYPYLYQNKDNFQSFVKELKKNLKLTTADKVENLRKQIDFINGIIKYLNN